MQYNMSKALRPLYLFKCRVVVIERQARVTIIMIITTIITIIIIIIIIIIIKIIITIILSLHYRRNAVEYIITQTGNDPILHKETTVSYLTAAVKRSLQAVETFQREQIASTLK